MSNIETTGQRSITATVGLEFIGSGDRNRPDEARLTLDDALLRKVARSLVSLRLLGLPLAEIKVGLDNDPVLLDEAGELWNEGEEPGATDFQPSSFWLVVTSADLQLEVWDGLDNCELQGSVHIESVKGLKGALADLEGWAMAAASEAIAQYQRPANGKRQRWEVRGVYSDNAQPYASEVNARTALEAAVFGIVEGLSADGGGEIGVTEVETIPQSEDGLLTETTSELRLFENRQALENLVEAVDAAGDTLPETEVFYLRWLKSVLEECPLVGQFEIMTDRTQIDASTNAEYRWGITDDCSDYPTEALAVLCARAEALAGGVVAMELASSAKARQIYQILAACKHFEGPINDSSVCCLAAHELIVEA